MGPEGTSDVKKIIFSDLKAFTKLAVSYTITLTEARISLVRWRLASCNVTNSIERIEF